MDKNQHSKDTIYTEKISEINDFKFDETVANVFPDMLNRSIPGYVELVEMIGTSAKNIVQPDTAVYDLGCSLGAVSAAVYKNCNELNYYGIAVDNSASMTKRCQEILSRENSGFKTEIICDDVCNINIKNASLVVMNFTLQFIAPEKRLSLLQSIYNGLIPGGVFILSEKIASDSKEDQEKVDLLYKQFKIENGYSELEISQKREALENVLIPETFSQHKERLRECGFAGISKWFQKLNFVSITANK